jgi:tetratricopeptide (TPR) repeat protein
MATASVVPSGGTSLLLERQAQVAALRALADAARSGGGRFVVIEGTAGIGKTRLLAEVRAIARSAGMRVLAARGGELEGEFAYGIVRQLFEPLLAASSPELRVELLSGPAALVASLLGASQPAGSQDAAAEGSFAIVHGLYWLAANVALHQPTLLAIDDLHWADTPSLGWLLYLTRRLEGVPLLVVAATRPPEGEGHDPTLVAELIADPEAAAIRPEPLGRASIAVLARELHGLEPDEAFCAALESATGGNPLFVGAVLDAVAREGTSPTAEHAARLLEIGAQGVSRVVGLRLARLRPEALALLRAASVLGDGTELRHAAALAGVEAGELGPAATALVRLDLLRREGPLEFFHPVVRRAVYETLDVVERGAAHRSAAELLHKAGALPESAAVHLLRVAPQTDPFVVSTLRQAAERSLAQGAADAAVGYLARALEEQLDPAVRAEVLVELGLAERRTNGPAAADHLRAGLELLADPGRRGEVALELGRALWFTARIVDALAVFERALGEVDRERDADLYELLLAELISSAWWNTRTFPIAEAAIGELDLDALHGGLGSEILLATIAHYESRRALHREQAIELARRALASGNLLASGSIAFIYAVNALFRSGLLDEAVPIFNQAVAQATGAGTSSTSRTCCSGAASARPIVAIFAPRSPISGRRSSSPPRTARVWPGRTSSASWRMRCWSRGRRTRRRASSTGVASPSSSRSTRSPWSGFGSTAPVCASRPEAPSGESRSCAKWARPFGWSCSAIQATCGGAAGPPKAFACSIGTTRRVRSPPTSSRSPDVGVTRMPSAPPCACSGWSRAARQASGCSARRSRCSRGRKRG